MQRLTLIIGEDKYILEGLEATVLSDCLNLDFNGDEEDKDPAELRRVLKAIYDGLSGYLKLDFIISRYKSKARYEVTKAILIFIRQIYKPLKTAINTDENIEIIVEEIPDESDNGYSHHAYTI